MKVKTGIYEHFKGKRYRVLGVAKHSETLEDLVVYEVLHENNLSKLWVRPVEMFLAKTIRHKTNCSPEHTPCVCFRGQVELDGKMVPRFKYIGK